MACITVEDVVAVSAQETIVPIAAGQGVVAAASEDEVVAVAAAGSVGIVIAVDQVIAVPAACSGRRHVVVVEPRVPELRHLTQAMNSMVQRVRQTFEEQARQVEMVRRQASCDAMTGLWHRQHFLTVFELMLEREDAASEGTLVLVRLLDLAGLNVRLGRRQTDRLIVTLSQAVQAWGAGVDDAGAGRLNGSDFALVLPNRQVRSEEVEAWSRASRAICSVVSTSSK